MDSRNPAARPEPPVERELADALVRAHRGELLALLSRGMGHDLRNPLNALAIQLELIGDKLRELGGGEVPPQLAHNLTAAKAQVGRLDEGLRRFAAFAVPGSTRVAGDLGSAIREATALCRHEARGANVNVELELEEDLPHPGAELALDHVLVATILGAIEGCGGGGTLRIEAMRVGAEACVRFVDDGRGEPSPPGRWVVEELVRSLHGTLHAEAVAARGTTLTLTFPAGRAPPAARVA